MNTESIIRPATQAYRFYEGDPQRLREEVSHFLDRHQAGDSDQDVAALIVPHAGYYYSGNVAAKAFKQLNPERKYKRIFLLGPSHHAWLDGASVDGEADFYATPLGNVPVDKETAQALIAHRADHHRHQRLRSAETDSHGAEALFQQGQSLRDQQRLFPLPLL